MVLKREGRVCLVRRTDLKLDEIHFEVWDVKPNNIHFSDPNPEGYDKAERAPNNEAWGVRGFTHKTRAEAEIKFAELVELTKSKSKK